MQLSTKVAGMCSSLAFLVTALPGFYQQARPMDFTTISSETFSGTGIAETLVISLMGSLAAGMIGFTIGDILSKPQNSIKPSVKPGVPTSSASPEPEVDYTEVDYPEDIASAGEQSALEPEDLELLSEALSEEVPETQGS